MPGPLSWASCGVAGTFPPSARPAAKRGPFVDPQDLSSCPRDPARTGALAFGVPCLVLTHAPGDLTTGP